MKKLIYVLMFIFVSSSFAGDYKYSLSPYLGYRFFNDDRDFKDRPEVGLKVERFLSDNLGIELGLGYVNSKEKITQKDVDLFSYLAHLKYYFNFKEISPYIVGGIGGDLTRGMKIGPSIGAGLNYKIDEKTGFFGEIRNNYLFGSGNDVI